MGKDELRWIHQKNVWSCAVRCAADNNESDPAGWFAECKEMFSHMDGSAGAASAIDALERHAVELFDAVVIDLYRFDNVRQKLVRLRGSRHSAGPAAEYVALGEPASAIARCARERRRLTMVGVSSPGTAPPASKRWTSLIAPLLSQGRLLGVMSVRSRSRQACRRRTREMFSMLSFGATSILVEMALRERLDAAVFALVQAEREKQSAQAVCAKLTEACHTDPLTGLYNRRFLHEQIAADVGLCLRRYEQAPAHSPADADLLFFMIDIDHFKEVNDGYGHAAGDMMLRQMRDCLKDAIRVGDYLIRWGGEEFLMVAREADRRNAETIAERLREAVSAWDFNLPGGVRLRRTCSVGFACYPYLRERPTVLEWTDVVCLADSQLYRAKVSGRNAWAGLHGRDSTPAMLSLDSLLRRQESAADAGEILLVASKPAL
ncbi:MAG TPA: GGDEF domain-containing protein [Burkholderiaceae bacterium]